MQPEARFLLQDIRDYGREAMDAVGALSVDDILAERFREHAILRTMQIVGEAAARLMRLDPAGFPGLELRQAAGLRNILVHGYAKVRMHEVVSTVRSDLPRLLANIERLLADQDS